MTDKEKLEQIDESVEQTPSISGGAEKDLAKELGIPSRKDIPSSYKSWESSSLRQGSPRGVVYEYGEGKDDIIGAVLIDYSYYPGGGCGMEYGVKLFVKRGDKTDMERIVYRDSYSAARDDWSKAFTHIDKIEVEGDRVKVTVSSSSRTSSYTFFLSKPEKIIEEETLSVEEQEKFKDLLKSEKERLLEQETRHSGKYPVSYDLSLGQIPGMFSSGGMEPYDERPYDKAEIVDEFVDLEKGTACIVIKTQIDACAGSGKQFQWLKYQITPEGTKLIESDQAYQSELKSGKQISIRAS